MTQEDFEDIKSKMLSNMEKLIQQIYAKARTGDLRAAETYNHLIKTKSDIVARFEALKHEFDKEEKPIYEIIIGKPEVVDIKKKEDEKHEKN